MKKLLLLLLLMPLFCIGQDLPIVDDKIVYEKIYDHPGISKDVLFGAAKKFIGVHFKRGSSVIQSEDINSGLIICKGNIDAYEVIEKKWWGQTLVGGTFHFTMQFEVKENKARVKIFDIHTSSTSQYGTTDTPLESIMFKEARNVNTSKPKYKAKRMEKFNKTVELLNKTFIGTLDTYESEINEYSNDDW